MKKVLLVALVALVATSYIVCKAGDVFSNFGGGAVEGNGNVIKKEITGLGNFDEVGNGISANMILTQGSEFKVVYEGESNLLELIKFEVKGNSLNVENKKNSWNSWTTSRKGITIYITMPNLKAVALGGSGDISSTNDFSSDNLDIAIGGSGNIQLSGSANKIEVAIGGSGDVDLSKLKAKRGEIAIGGSGNCEVQVSDELEVAIAGSGDVKCKGRPRLKESVSGSGEVELMD
jgi:hypothetical protein